MPDELRQSPLTSTVWCCRRDRLRRPLRRSHGASIGRAEGPVV